MEIFSVGDDATFPYLFAAYGAIWVLFFAYLVRLRQRKKSLGRALDELEERLEATSSND